MLARRHCHRIRDTNSDNGYLRWAYHKFKCKNINIPEMSTHCFTMRFHEARSGYFVKESYEAVSLKLASIWFQIRFIWGLGLEKNDLTSPFSRSHCTRALTAARRDLSRKDQSFTETSSADVRSRLVKTRLFFDGSFNGWTQRLDQRFNL